jgi:hypothetical protein
LLVEVNSAIGHEDGPYSDVKLPGPVEHGLLKVLLNEPSVSHRLGMNKVDDVLQVLEDLNAPSLVEVVRLH